MSEGNYEEFVRLGSSQLKYKLYSDRMNEDRAKYELQKRGGSS